MSNKALKDKIYNTGSGDKKNYEALSKQESRLNQAKEYCQKTKDCSEFNRLGGESKLKELENIIHTAQEANYQIKKTGKDAGRENQFIKTHEKDRDNANPTAVGGIPKMNKGNIKDKIMTNKEVYNEGLEKELSEMRYLIEYMTNNKKQKI